MTSKIAHFQSCCRGLRSRMDEGQGAGFGVLVVVLVFAVLGGRWHRLRLAQVHSDAGGRTIAPGADGIKIGYESGVVQAGGDAGAGELGSDVHIESLHHRQAHADGIHAAPGPRAIVKQAEFDGERVGAFAMRDEEIDAAGVVVEDAARVWRRCS